MRRNVFLLILDKNPYKAAELIPDRLKFKSLLELCQLICSAGISDVFKPIKQGKELQEWIKKNQTWILMYYTFLRYWCFFNINMQIKTIEKTRKIQENLLTSGNRNDDAILTTAIFRYVKEYAEFTEYESNSELDIDVAISEYKRYLEYKEKEYNKKRCKK